MVHSMINNVFHKKTLNYNPFQQKFRWKVTNKKQRAVKINGKIFKNKLIVPMNVY
jgi:hypothetical protein